MVREARLAAMWARLQRAKKCRDPSSVLGADALRDARRLAEEYGGRDEEVQYVLGWFYWSRSLYGRHLGLPESQTLDDLKAAVEAFTPCFVFGDGDLPEPLIPALVEIVAPKAARAFRQAQASPGRVECTAAASMLRRVLAATPSDDPHHAERLSLLAEALRAWGPGAHATLHRDVAIACFEEVTAAAPAGHPDRVTWLTRLGGLLQARGQQTRAVPDLDAAVVAARKAMAEAPPGSPAGTRSLWIRGIALASRFEVTKAVADLEGAIGCLRTVAADARPEDPLLAVYLSHLGTSLRARYQLTGSPADLDEAIVVGQRALDLGPAEGIDRASVLSTLGQALWARYQLTGEPAVLDHAIVLGQQALETGSDVDRMTMLSNLGGRFAARFDRTGGLADADAAVEWLRQAADAARVDDDPDRAGMLSNLGAMLLRRFERTGALADLTEAVTLARESVAACTDDGLAVTALSNLGAMLLRRFERTGAPSDLDEAVTVARAALEASDGMPSRAVTLANLGSMLQARFERTGMPADLDEAVTVARAAVDASADQPGRTRALSNLGNALMRRWERDDAPTDLDEAIAIGRLASAAGSDDHADRVTQLSNLGAALSARFHQSASTADLDDAIFCHLAAVDAAVSPLAAVKAGDTAARLLAQRGDDVRAAEAAAKAVVQLPQVAPRRLERDDQQHAVAQFAGLAGRAAALALAAPGGTAAERAQKALRLLETGRAVLLSQALETRSDLTELRHHHSGLATRYLELRAQLDAPADTVTPIRLRNKEADQGPSRDRQARDRRLSAEEFALLLAEIRGLEGFSDFALPPAETELVAQAAHGPVVVFNISAYRSDALLVTTQGVRSLELPDLTPGTVTDQVNAFRSALHTARVSKDQDEQDAAQKVLVTVLQWLWDKATGPVLDALGLRDSRGEAEEDWPRVWWVPGGLLGLLPLHASGHHDDAPNEPHRRTVMDRVVSSYTPTVRALRHARERARTAAASSAARSLIVAMPTTPGLHEQGWLPYVEDEVELLRERLPDALLLEEPEPGDCPADPQPLVPTLANVLEHLPKCAIAHFSCHGSSHPTDPSRSLLLLHDHAEAPLTVGRLASVALDEARLAYLSACRTAAIDTSALLDEAIHLTSAFQLAGFPHVIGTLWEINDRMAVTVADLFYAALGPGSAHPDPDRSARALHRAVRLIRDGHDQSAPLHESPWLWAAYLHAGA
ncbi:CHAT domain-containing protein [Kitasatospora sp. NPDC047058]|uniref:CHAT domain-containing tetratricopeptide repeat protein n=1 Tax=Kitasatospora sp. NPDC047058 TaxID=3155620 RepID=UPI00340D4250